MIELITTFTVGKAKVMTRNVLHQYLNQGNFFTKKGINISKLIL